MQHIVGFIELHQARGAENDHYRIYLVEFLVAIVNGYAQLGGSAGGEDVYRVRHRGAGEQLAFQFFCKRSRQAGHVHASFGQRICQHHAWAACVGDDGEILATEMGKGEDASSGGQFLAGETPHDACFPEQRLHSGVT